jgi:uncharacterized membrane protein
LRVVRWHWPLVCLGLFAFCWVVARACLQSVIIDEADSYGFASASWDLVRYPSSGNHVLNTMLVWLFTRKLGLNELTLRLPAILGAAIYISAAGWLCATLGRRKILHLPLFICLAYNPMVLDYLVAARGYSLAVGFLLAAVAVLTSTLMSEAKPVLACAIGSVFLGLSFCANFSFAIADAVTMLLFFAIVRPGVSARLGAAYPCFLPGILVTLLVCGSTLVRWPREQLYFGETSLVATWNGLIAASFHELNPGLFGESIPYRLRHVGQVLTYAAVILTVAMLSRALKRKSGSPFLTVSLWWASVIVTTAALHWLAFVSFGLLMPKDRTALFFVPLGALAMGSVLAHSYGAEKRDPVRALGIGVLLIAAVYFGGCLRLGYFKEWRYNADTKQL